jgi:predicted nucleotidyltransferase
MDHGIVPDSLLRPVVEYFRPRKVILFGSRARRDADADSDYDLLVIVDDDTPRDLLSLQAGYEARRSFPRAADVVPCRATTYAKRAGIVGTLSHAAATEGVVVYERK